VAPKILEEYTQCFADTGSSNEDSFHRAQLITLCSP
jgi:hypothetical protein